MSKQIVPLLIFVIVTDYIILTQDTSRHGPLLGINPKVAFIGFTLLGLVAVVQIIRKNNKIR